MINNRQQNGRRRGRGGNNGPGTGGGNGPRQGGQGRPDNGNRIDNRARGNASQLYEKYKNLASDSQRQGDRVNTEYYLQFADHYFRVLADQRGRFEDQQPRRQQRDDFDMDGGDDDYGDEGEPIRAGEQQSDDQSDRQHDRSNDRYQDRQMRDDRPRSDNRGDRNDGQRNDGQRSEGQRYDNQRDAQRSEGQRDDRPRRTEADARPPRNWEPRVERDGNRVDGNRDQQPQRDAGQREPLQREPRRERAAVEPRTDSRPDQRSVPQEVAGQRRSDPPVEGESLEQRAETVLEADAPPPRRGRGRPRREAAPVVADAVDTAPAAFDSDRLPPSLNIGAGMSAANDSADEAPKPRRRRVRAAVEETPDAAE